MTEETLIQEKILEDEWLENVFGTKSSLQNEEWLNKVTNDDRSSFVYQVKELRAMILEKAELEVKF